MIKVFGFLRSSRRNNKFYSTLNSPTQQFIEATVWRHAKMNDCPLVSWGMDALTKTLT